MRGNLHPSKSSSRSRRMRLFVPNAASTCPSMRSKRGDNATGSSADREMHGRTGTILFLLGSSNTESAGFSWTVNCYRGERLGAMILMVENRRVCKMSGVGAEFEQS